MTDVVDSATRSRMMSGIKGINTNPEKQIRSILHRNGFRFSLHPKDLPGKPDIVLPKYGAVIFVHGCFWHRHRCGLFKWPKSNPEFWRRKIEGNTQRDKVKIRALRKCGWRILVVWECALKGKTRCQTADLSVALRQWLTSSESQSELVPSLKG